MGEALLLHAVKHSNIEEVLLLLFHKKAPADARSSTGGSGLHIAAKAGNGKLAELLLSYGADPNAQELRGTSGNGGKTPLMYAAEGGHTHVASVLLEHGAQPQLQSAKGMSALHCAAIHGHSPVVQLLLAQGADPHVRDSFGRNAACWAEEWKHAAVLEVFSSVGVQPRSITVKDRLQHRQESLANAALRKDAKGKAAAKSAGGPKKKK
jgi:ankyrin repeat protein